MCNGQSNDLHIGNFCGRLRTLRNLPPRTRHFRFFFVCRKCGGIFGFEIAGICSSVSGGNAPEVQGKSTKSAHKRPVQSVPEIPVQTCAGISGQSSGWFVSLKSRLFFFTVRGQAEANGSGTIRIVQHRFEGHDSMYRGSMADSGR